MSTRFTNADGSVIIRSDGCQADFVEHLATHQAFLKRYFDVPTSRWDYSIESLRALDDLLCPQKKPQPVFPRALVDSVIAYCGEVLRSQLGGHWFLFTCEADEMGGSAISPVSPFLRERT
jgi:hypothetical protein